MCGGKDSAAAVFFLNTVFKLWCVQGLLWRWRGVCGESGLFTVGVKCESEEEAGDRSRRKNTVLVTHDFTPRQAHTLQRRYIYTEYFSEHTRCTVEGGQYIGLFSSCDTLS